MCKCFLYINKKNKFKYSTEPGFDVWFGIPIIQTIKTTVFSLVLFYEVLPYLADKISQILAFGNTNTMNEPKKSSTQKKENTNSVLLPLFELQPTGVSVVEKKFKLNN